MVERAGVDVDPGHAFAPGAANRLGQKPAAVALPGELRHQADEGELALVRLAEVELDHADFGVALVHHGI